MDRKGEIAELQARLDRLRSNEMTVGDFVRAFGGNEKLAAACGVGRTAVSNWRTWNRMPPHLYLRIKRAALERGLKVPPEQLFENEPIEAA